MPSLDSFLSRFRRRRVSPTETLGSSGAAIFGGYIEEFEKDRELGSGSERYRTYSDMLANVSIVAAGTRFFLNLVAKASWSFSASEEDASGEFAERAESMLTDDPLTPWHRIVRRSSMYRFYGFSVQEWTARRRDDGLLTFADIAPRAQRTIERWDVDDTGRVLGALQTSPQTQLEIYLPREKLLYIVDDTLNDSPEGLGLFRHLVAPSRRLKRYEQLEGFGFETDLRGIPIGRVPFTELAEMVRRGTITQEERIRIEAPLREFIEKHIKSPALGLILDSMTYETRDESGRPSGSKLWNVELLRGSAASFSENAAAIERLNRELARVLGVEQLLLGSDVGSFSLSRDKTNSFFLLVDSALTEIRETVADDLLKTLWRLNGWPVEMMPEIKTEAIRFIDAEQIAAALRDMATAGAILAPDDPAINDLRSLLGISAQDDTVAAALDANLGGEGPDDGGVIPEGDE